MAMVSEDFAHMEKLKDHSYFSIWKFQIVVFLKAEDLYNVVSTEFREAEQDTNWGKKDAKAQRYIGMFDNLCSIYERDSSHNKSSLLQNFFNYKIDKVVSGLSDLQNLSMKLKSVGHRVDDETMMGCKICKMDNHTEQNCYFRDRNKSTTSNRDKVAFITESVGGNPEGSWVLDSGCTSHIINNSDTLTNVTGIESDIITSKKNENMCAELKGDIESNKKSNIGIQNYKKWRCCQITDNGVEILKSRTKITSEKDNAGLYNINLNSSETALLSERKQTSAQNLWHIIIGNLKVDSMKKLATLSSGLEKLKFRTSEIRRETSLTSKETRKHFGKARKRERERAMRPAESKWNSRVNKIRCDIGGEYVANELTDWCREREIKIDYDPSATPRLNGRVERLNRTLMEKMRALLFDFLPRERVVGRGITHCNVPAEQKPIRYNTDSLVDSEETLLGLVDNMEERRNTTVLQGDVVDEPFHIFRSCQDTATSEMLYSLPETATEIENCNHHGRKERIKRKP
ncbi:hypothetical protein PR048_021822 [Dryococelus australis]|uniref:Integrase catalytic domain-containing protein n=1 Tax=Dryococelus australis TaxID=614101 RepID=A0ABQ9GZA4_9NEOP|nr:hypothetical protein PR048_021822 [Dryococelus australis]